MPTGNLLGGDQFVIVIESLRWGFAIELILDQRNQQFNISPAFVATHFRYEISTHVIDTFSMINEAEKILSKPFRGIIFIMGLIEGFDTI